MMEDGELAERLAEVERRIAAIERSLGQLSTPRVEATVPLPRRPLPTSPPHQSPHQSPHSPPPLPVISIDPPIAEATAFKPLMPYRATEVVTVQHGDLERAIGLKLAGWIGAIVLLIGMGFAVKLVYERRWFAEVPPAVWLGIIFAAGAALIAAGEWVFRKINEQSAVGLYGAGVATLFLAAYVGESYYELYSPATALTLMAVASLIGGAVALRANSVSIALLALLGGNLAPILVGDRNAPPQGFMRYLLAMQLVALFLASVGRGGKWWTLRGVSLATMAYWTSQLIQGPATQSLTLIFATVSASLFQLEPIITTLRRRVSSAAAPAALAVITTSAYTALWLYQLQDASNATQARAVLIIAAIVGAMGVLLTMVRACRESGIASLAMAHRWSAVGLIALAIPIGLRGAPVEAAWAVMSIVLAVVGRRTGSKIGNYGAAIVWLAAMGHAAIDWHDHPLTWVTIDGVDLTRQFLIAMALVPVGQFIAVMLAAVGDQRARKTAIELSLIASIAWCLAAMLQLPAMAASFTLLVYALALMIGQRAFPEFFWREEGLITLAVASADWIIGAASERSASDFSAAAYWILLNTQFLVGAALSAGIAAVPTIMDRTHGPTVVLPPLDRRRRRWIAWPVAGFFFLVAASFEIDRAAMVCNFAGSIHAARQIGLTILWISAAAIALIALRRFDREPTIKRQWPTIQPVLLRLIALKFIVVDLFLVGIDPHFSRMTTLFNLDVGGALVVLWALAIDIADWPRHPWSSTKNRTAPLLLSALVVWTVGTMEIARASQISLLSAGSATLSVYWSIVAIVSVVCGFAIRNAGLRFFGLALFAVTCLKVIVIDMSELATEYRVLSFMGLGALLIGTSVVYGKFGGKLLEGGAKPQAADG